MRLASDEKEEVIFARFEERTRQVLLDLIDDDLIREHAAKPLGQHSDKLERVITYFRSGAAAGKYVIVCTKLHEEWRIGQLSGVRGQPPTIVGDERFSSIDAAFHGIFLRRIRELREPSPTSIST